MITKADYDELVRLRGLEYEYVFNDKNGNKSASKLGRSVGIRKGLFNGKVRRGTAIHIPTAIAEYERAQEVNHE